MDPFFGSIFSSDPTYTFYTASTRLPLFIDTSPDFRPTASLLDFSPIETLHATWKAEIRKGNTHKLKTNRLLCVRVR
ncbi:hypothetical protein L1887_18899 [Cichorium endivia]|nr:hypothetical protein L1887_18899 [Cichorium endivia]